MDADRGSTLVVGFEVWRRRCPAKGTNRFSRPSGCELKRHRMLTKQACRRGGEGCPLWDEMVKIDGSRQRQKAKR